MDGMAIRRVLNSTLAVLACLWLAAPPVAATEVGLAGLFPGKALLTINGGTPRSRRAPCRWRY